MFTKPNRAIATIIATLVGIGSASAAEEPLRLKPSSQWIVNYADDSCRLARRFGKGDQAVIIAFDRLEPTTGFKLFVSGMPVKTERKSKEAVFQFGPSETEQKVVFSTGRMSNNKPALILGGTSYLSAETDEQKEAWKKAKYGVGYVRPPIGKDRQAAVTYLRVGKPLLRPLILELGPMAEPLASLSNCTDELVTHWGIDVEKHVNLSRHATPKRSPAKWIGVNDYPTDLLYKGVRGFVAFRLSVDIKGKPTACHIQQTTRPGGFDKAVCKALMKRAKFLPALDAEGRPIASYYRNNVRFHTPD